MSFNLKNRMKKQPNEGDPVLKNLLCPKKELSNDFLFYANEIGENKLHYVKLFAAMQRALLIHISKNHDFPNEYMDNLETDLFKLQELIANT